MIRVNLNGILKKKAAAAAARSSGPTNVLPIVHVLIVAGAALGGYLWYSGLTAEAKALGDQIAEKEATLKKLAAVIKQDEIFQTRKADIKRRIDVISGLRKDQVSPVVMLDMLGDAIDRTHFVWLSTLNQNNLSLSMSGAGNSVDALASFVANLESTNYFHNINLQKFEDARGNFNFSMTCDFSPPSSPAVQQPSGAKGAN